MKIEKVNDNQIRCTLTKDELAQRQLKISEIAYGSEKAKMLFKDVMQQASYEYGFEAEDIPLMIEAIPMSTGCIVFIITKVEDPEELDTRFSKFAPSVHEDDDEDYEDNPYEDKDSGNVLNALPGAVSDVFDLFKKITDSAAKQMGAGAPAANQGKAAKPGEAAAQVSIRFYSFNSLDSVISACKVLNNFYKGESSLYKDEASGKYYLLLTRGRFDQKEFIKVCNILLEYGTAEKTTSASVAYLEEHYDLLAANNAVFVMAQI